MVDRLGEYGALAFKLGWERVGHWTRSVFSSEEERMRSFERMEDDMAETLFQSMVRLRGTALKLGQTLSMEHGLIPERMRKRLEATQSSVPALSYAAVRKVILADLGKYPEQLFESFEPVAFAAASLGQVHLATTKSGERVAVKVLYPGIKKSLESDFKILQSVLSTLPEKQLLSASLEELRVRILNEADYVLERENAMWFRENLRADGIVTPKVFEDLCSPHVLTLEYLEGEPISRMNLEEIPQEQRDLMGRGILGLFKISVFGTGVLHTDPHPGNFIWLRERRCLGLVDFGSVKKDFTPDVLKLFGMLMKAEATPETIELYGRLGADLEGMTEDDRLEFYGKVIRPFQEKMREILLAQEFSTESTLARDLRATLLAQAFHPRLKGFSAEFTMLHKTFHGTLALMNQLGARIH